MSKDNKGKVVFYCYSLCQREVWQLI